QNYISQNRIFNNSRLGIDLGNDGVTLNWPFSPEPGPNDLVNFPIITSATSAGNTTIIQATVHGSPNNFLDRVEFFANTSPDPSGFGQGETYLGSVYPVQTAYDGTATVTVTFPVNTTGKFISATLIDGVNTSEFAQDVAVTPLVPTLTSLSPSSTTEGA